MENLILFLVYAGQGLVRFIEIWGPCAIATLLVLCSITLVTKDKAWFKKLIIKIGDF